MKTHPELPLDLVGKGDISVHYLEEVRLVPGHLFPPIYGDKAREVLLNQEAQHAIRMASTSVSVHTLPIVAQVIKKNY
jgi:hypothetical protein